MANLQNIKVLSKARKISLRSISEHLGVTEQGLHKMIREETMSAVALEKIAKILNVNICVFFDHDILCERAEEYNAKGDRAISAKNIDKIDQRNMTLVSSPKNTQEEDSQEKIIALQTELLNAKSEIINLLKNRNESK